MKKAKNEKNDRSPKKNAFSWLIPTVLVLFILEIVTLPLIVLLTYAGNSETPYHTLTFDGQHLYWDGNSELFENYAAKLSLFSSYYENVQSDDSEQVIAPGTESEDSFRLVNSSGQTATFYVYLYEQQKSDVIPVTASMTSTPVVADADTYPVPENIPEGATILKVLTGEVDDNGIVDFKIEWNWEFYRGEIEDILDTSLGDNAVIDSATDELLGFYLVIDADEILPEPPGTGDTTEIFVMIALIIVSAAVLVFFLIQKKRMEKENL